MTTRIQKLDLRLTPAAKQILDAAAHRSFGLDAERWTAFTSALDAPVRELPRTRRLLNEPSIFEEN